MLNMIFFAFVILLLLPVLAILILRTQEFHFKLIEAAVVVTVNVLAAIGWVILWEVGDVHDYTITELIELARSSFLYISLVGFISGLLMYLGAKLWRCSRIEASFLFCFGCGVFLIPAFIHVLLIKAMASIISM